MLQGTKLKDLFYSFIILTLSQNPRLTLHIIVVWIGVLLLEQLGNASSHRSAALLEASSAEAAVLRGQKLILSMSTLTHELQTLIKHVRSELSLAERHGGCSGLCFGFRNSSFVYKSSFCP